MKKESFRATGDSNPWPLDPKSNALPTELAVLGYLHVTLSHVVNLNVLSIFFDSYNFSAHRNSFLMTLVYSPFSCFPASSSLEKESSRPTRDSNSWSLDQKSNALPTELAVLGHRHVTLSPVVNLNVLSIFFDSYNFAAHRNSFWIALDNSEVFCFPASISLKKESFRPTRTRTLGRWIKSPTLYRLS